MSSDDNIAIDGEFSEPPAELSLPDRCMHLDKEELQALIKTGTIQQSNAATLELTWREEMSKEPHAQTRHSEPASTLAIDNEKETRTNDFRYGDVLTDTHHSSDRIYLASAHEERFEVSRVAHGYDPQARCYYIENSKTATLEEEEEIGKWLPENRKDSDHILGKEYLDISVTHAISCQYDYDCKWEKSKLMEQDIEWQLYKEFKTKDRRKDHEHEVSLQVK